MRWSRNTVLWIGVLGLMSAFQLWRGAYVDGLLFAGLVTMLVVDRITGGRIVLLRKAADAPRVAVLSVATVLGVILIFAPRHSLLDAFAISVTGTLALIVAWVPSGKRPERPAPAYRRTAVTWSLLGVALCLWEAAAYIASVSGGGDHFPTISVLLEPMMEWPIGRAVFTGLWLLAGLSLLGVWAKK